MHKAGRVVFGSWVLGRYPFRLAGEGPRGSSGAGGGNRQPAAPYGWFGVIWRGIALVRMSLPHVAALYDRVTGLFVPRMLPCCHPLGSLPLPGSSRWQGSKLMVACVTLPQCPDHKEHLHAPGNLGCWQWSRARPLRSVARPGDATTGTPGAQLSSGWCQPLLPLLPPTGACDTYTSAEATPQPACLTPLGQG